MSDVRFDPDAWTRAGGDMKETSQHFQQAAIDIQLAPSGSSSGPFGLFGSPVDSAIGTHDERLSLAWYDVAGNMVEKLNSDAAKLSATGKNYSQRADSSEYVVKRYWNY